MPEHAASARMLPADRADMWDRFETEVPELCGRPFQGMSRRRPAREQLGGTA
jgi:hypothetical protein